jgi:hypothetical protein
MANPSIGYGGSSVHGQCPSLENLSFGERLWTVSTACLGRSIRDKDLFSSVENELHILTLRAC